MPPQGAAYNVDWILSNTSNVHVANDRAWFTTYTPYRTKISGIPGGGPSIDVHGIGTVVLPTRTYDEGKSHDFIKKNYRHSGNFMLCHGLKPFDNDDCDEAVCTVRALMED